jgi:prevent-host-death family protein
VAITVNIHQAKTHLSKLLERVGAGEEIIIAKAGKPVAKLSAYQPSPASRQPGWAKGEIRLAADFDEPMSEEELRLWYDGEVFPK